MMRCLVSALALAAALAVGCSKDEAPPPPAPSEDTFRPPPDAPPPPPPAMQVLLEIEEQIAAKEAIEDPVERARALGEAAAGWFQPVIEKFEPPEAPAEVKAKAFELLTRIAGAIGDPAKVDALAARVLPAGVATPGDLRSPTDPRVFAGRMLAALAPRLTPDRLAEAAVRVAELARAIRASWGCADRAARAAAGTAPEVHERALVEALGGLLAAVQSPNGTALQSRLLPVLLDALRESPRWQDVSVHRAALEAAFTLAPLVDEAGLDGLAAALFEAMLRNGLRYGTGAEPEAVPLEPWAHRALVRLAVLGERQRDAVLLAVLRGLAAALGPEARESGLEEVAPAETVALLAQPCGDTLGVACEESRRVLAAWADGGGDPAKATCNAGKDPDKPEARFDWGLETEHVWELSVDLAIDALPPSRDGRPLAGNGPGAQIERLFEALLRRTDDWAAQVIEARKLHDALVELYPGLLGGEEPAATPVAAAGRGRRPAAPPELSAAVKPIHDTLAGFLDNPRTRTGGETRGAAHTLIAALRGPDAAPTDRALCRDLLARVFDDVQRELSVLADVEHGHAAVYERLWRAVAAARGLGWLGVTGENDAALDLVLRLIRFAFDQRAGFPISTSQSFPALVLQPRGRFDDAGRPRRATALVPRLLEAVVAWQRPTPPVLHTLLQLMTRSALVAPPAGTTGTLRFASFAGTDPAVLSLRADAAHAFFAVFRRDDPATGLDEYLTRLRAQLDQYRFLVHDLAFLRALEQTGANAPAFRLYPPPAKAAAATAEDGEEPAWTTTMPERSELFRFDAYRDALVTCAVPEREAREDVAKWRTDFSEEQRTAYCKKWVQPYATRYAGEMRGVDVPRLGIADARCWTHMREIHASQLAYCADRKAGTPPARDWGLTDDQCAEVTGREAAHEYCLELRRLPQFVRQGMPTLHGCYDQFPWLRDEEPLGPRCDHIAARILAAYLYVKLRSEARAPAPDGVTFDRLRAILPLEELLSVFRLYPVRPDAATLGKLERLVRELARVRGEVTVFRPPRGPAARPVARTVERPAGLTPPPYVAVPWYWQDGMTAREPRAFEPLLQEFLELCRAPGAEEAAGCAEDGGRLPAALAAVAPDDTPGPLAQGAASLVAWLDAGRAEETLRELAAVLDVERCVPEQGPDVNCLHAIVFPAMTEIVGAEIPRRARALALFAGMAAWGRTEAGEPLCRAMANLRTFEPPLQPVVRFAWRRARPECGGEPGAWTPQLDNLLPAP
ncbi:MAG: hypothetical protein GYA57_05490 [Myxococcales bacterium]|nr:hypothetical protein [Myxococcales bacterium]